MDRALHLCVITAVLGLFLSCADHSEQDYSHFISEFGYPSYYSDIETSVNDSVAVVNCCKYEVAEDPNGNDPVILQSLSKETFETIHSGKWYVNSKDTWRIYVIEDHFAMYGPSYSIFYFAKNKNNGRYYATERIVTDGDYVTQVDIYLRSTSNNRLYELGSFEMQREFFSSNYFDLLNEMHIEDDYYRETNLYRRIEYRYKRNGIKSIIWYSGNSRKKEREILYKTKKDSSIVTETFYEGNRVSTYEYVYLNQSEYPYKTIHNQYKGKVFKKDSTKSETKYDYLEYDKFGNWTTRVEHVVTDGIKQNNVLTKREFKYLGALAFETNADFNR